MEITKRFEVVEDVSMQRTIVSEIYKHFKDHGVPMHFSVLNKWCKEIGVQGLQNIFQEVIRMDLKYQPGSMFKMVASQKKNIVWEDLRIAESTTS